MPWPKKQQPSSHHHASYQRDQQHWGRCNHSQSGLRGEESCNARWRNNSLEASEQRVTTHKAKRVLAQDPSSRGRSTTTGRSRNTSAKSSSKVFSKYPVFTTGSPPLPRRRNPVFGSRLRLWRQRTEEDSNQMQRLPTSLRTSRKRST